MYLSMIMVYTESSLTYCNVYFNLLSPVWSGHDTGWRNCPRSCFVKMLGCVVHSSCVYVQYRISSAGIDLICLQTLKDILCPTNILILWRFIWDHNQRQYTVKSRIKKTQKNSLHSVYLWILLLSMLLASSNWEHERSTPSLPCMQHMFTK